MKLLAHLHVLCKAEHGASLIELALVTPILLLLMIGAVDLGRAYYVGLEVANAAHSGAEYGSRNPSNTAGITAAARQSAPNLPNMIVRAMAVRTPQAVLLRQRVRQARVGAPMWFIGYK